MVTPGAETSGLICPQPRTGPRELNPAICPTKLVPKNGFKRIGKLDIAPLAGSVVLLPPGIRLSRYWASSDPIFAPGMVDLTAGGVFAVRTKKTAPAPA